VASCKRLGPVATSTPPTATYETLERINDYTANYHHGKDRRVVRWSRYSIRPNSCATSTTTLKSSTHSRPSLERAMPLAKRKRMNQMKGQTARSRKFQTRFSL